MGEAISTEHARTRVSHELIAAVRAQLPTSRTFAEFESGLHAFLNELGRRVLSAELQTIADGFGDEVNVDERTYRRRGEGAVRYHTLCGSVAVRRAIYRLVGVHNGPTVVPLELVAGLQENATPALAFSVTQAFASGPLRDYEQAMAAAHREVPSRSTLERIGKRAGARIDDTIAEVEPSIRASEPRLAGVCSISAGIDRTTVPMAELIPNAEMPEPRIRRRPPPMTVQYRMAYVGTVSLHDVDGRVLVTKRFGASAAEGPERLVERIAAELRHQRTRYRVPISVIQDGALELWRLIEDMSVRHDIPIAARVIDRFHVDEHLAEACELAAGSDAVAAELYERWHYQLDHNDAAIDLIIRHLDALASHTEFGVAEGEPPPSFWLERGVVEMRADARDALEKHVGYFRSYRREIRYATRRRAGLPIGSGPTEGACKSLVTARFKRSGQRWFESGVVPCLSLRALHLSDRLRPAFDRYQIARSACIAAA
jgi:hypothetical protein